MLTMEQRHNRTFGGLHITNSGKCVNINNFTQSLISNHLKKKQQIVRFCHSLWNEAQN